MKKILIIPVFIVLVLSLSRCQTDDSLDPRPLLVQGQYMRLDITRKKIDFNNISTSTFGGMLTNPSNDVVKYELLVKLKRAYIPAQGGNPEVIGFESEYIPYETLTAFPQDLAITAQKVIDAYASKGTTIAVIKGDEFYFIAYSYDAQGNRIAFSNLSATIRGEEGYKQAYKFNTVVTTNLEGAYSNYKQ